jgi:soluble lytic murein transglycosylase-like protein
MSLSVDPVLESIILVNCNIYRIDPFWVKAIISTESQWNRYALRYEPEYNYLYNPKKYIGPNISYSTELCCQRISWGLGQIMGALAREQGHEGVMSTLLDPPINIRHICIRLDTLKKYSAESDFIFAGYNAGPGGMHKIDGHFFNQKYVDTINQYLKMFE